MSTTSMTNNNATNSGLAAKIVAIFKSTHFLPCILVTLITSVLAYGSGQRSQIWLLAPAVLLGQFSVGWCNDYLDRHRDRLAKRSEKPIVSGQVQANTIKVLSVAAGLLSVGFSLAYGREATVIYLIALGSAYLYNFRLKNSLLSVLTFIVSFGLLPVYVGLGSTPRFIPATWIIAASALWSIGIHIQNVIPDFEADAKTGIKGAVNYLTSSQAILASVVVLILSATIIGFGISGGASLFAWGVLGIFTITTIIFATSFLLKRKATASKASILMTTLGAILIMCSGPFIRM